MMTWRVAGVLVLLVAAGALTRAGEVVSSDSEVARRIEAIEQPESMRRWERIPWVTDLAEGQRQARREHRPILLWVSGDDPLERC